MLMTTPTSILLFAAGLGTRMAPVVNTHYFADQIERHLAGTKVSISDESDELLETGGGLKRALPLLGDGPVFTMNTDAVWRGANPIQVLKTAWQSNMDGLLLMIPRDHAIGHTGTGDFDTAPDGRISRGSDYVYSGVQIIRTDLLASISKSVFSMWDLWTPMLETNTLFGVSYDGAWCDVGRKHTAHGAQISRPVSYWRCIAFTAHQIGH